MLVSAILVATLLAAGYLLYLWLGAGRRDPRPPTITGRKLGSEREKAVEPIELVPSRRRRSDPLADPPKAGASREASGARAGRSEVPEMAAPAARASRERAVTSPEVRVGPAHARRVPAANPTIQISALELQSMVIDDEGTTLGVTARETAGPSRVSMQSDLDLSVEISLSGEEEDEPSGPFVPVAIAVASATDVGKKRKHNEDSIGVDVERSLYVLADGMGGYAAGEVASQMCVESILHAHESGRFEGEAIPGLPARGDELVRSIQAANREILAESRSNEARAGMGTTVVAVRFVPERQRLYIAHVGDSRLYRLREGELVQMTADHTLGALGVTGPSAQKLSRAVGVFDEVEVDLGIDVPEPGDAYLVCSDGLFKMVHEVRILELVAEGRSPEETADALVAEANARGGKDNISVIVARVSAVRPGDLRASVQA